MKRGVKCTCRCLAALLFCMFFFYVSPPVVFAQAETEANEVADYDALVSWLAANPEGGTVTLTGPINIEENDSILLQNVHIIAGNFGFAVTGELVLLGGVTIAGGAANPPIRVCNDGYLHIIGKNSITVSGAGGTALYFEDESAYLEDDSARLHLRAEGANALGIYAEIPLDLKWCTIEAAGGAELIAATEPVRLYLSRVETDGAVACTPNITFDTCMVSPSVTGANIISRKLTGVAPRSPYFFAAGEQATGYFDGKSLPCLMTLGAEGVQDEVEAVSILCNDEGVRYDKPGVYTMPGVLNPLYDDFSALDILSEACPVEITITVYDPGIPYFYAFNKIRNTFIISYYYWGAHEALTLWRSDDDGKSWRIYWQPGGEENDGFQVDYDEYSMDLCFLDPAELAAPALLVFEVGKGKGSDVLYVDAGSIINYGNGGDRDGGDRIFMPWEFFFGDPDDDEADTGGGANPPRNTGAGGGSRVSGDSDSTGNLDDASGESGHNGGSNQNADSAAAAQPLSGAARAATNEPGQATEPAEYENETTIAISGKRLDALMRSNAQMVPFARQDIQVWIPVGLLAGLQAADVDIFTLHIEKTAQPGVSVMFYLNGRALSGPFEEAFIVGIPWAETSGDILCMDSGGHAVPITFDAQNGLLLLTLFGCGTYTIETKSGGDDTGALKYTDSPINDNSIEAPGEALPQYAPGAPPLLAILAVGIAGICGTGGLVYILRKRQVKGGE